MKRSWFLPILGWLALAGGAIAAGAPNPVFETSARPAADNEIDRAVFARLAQLGAQPVLCSDAVFVRRAYLDVIGTLPTAQERASSSPIPNDRRTSAAR